MTVICPYINKCTKANSFHCKSCINNSGTGDYYKPRKIPGDYYEPAPRPWFPPMDPYCEPYVRPKPYCRHRWGIRCQQTPRFTN